MIFYIRFIKYSDSLQLLNYPWNKILYVKRKWIRMICYPLSTVIHLFNWFLNYLFNQIVLKTYRLFDPSLWYVTNDYSKFLWWSFLFTSKYTFIIIAKVYLISQLFVGAISFDKKIVHTRLQVFSLMLSSRHYLETNIKLTVLLLLLLIVNVDIYVKL